MFTHLPIKWIRGHTLWEHSGYVKLTSHFHLVKKVQPVTLQAWSGPEGSRELVFPDCMTTAQDSGKVVSPKHRPPLPQEMLLVLISVRG